MGSLRHFIKDVRNASTPSKERELISKESAKIRTRLRNDQLDVTRRRVYIQKLLYLYVMGEKTHFGQVDCINLIASDNFTNKRLGYLSAMLLLKDENPELLTLLVNMINQDLQHKNDYVVAMALHALGSLCNEELARDLCGDVINLILKCGNSNSYVLKQCLSVSSSIIKKDPNLIQQYMTVENGQLITNIYGAYYGTSNTANSLRRLSSPCTDGVLLSILEFVRSCLFQQNSYDFDDNFDEMMLKNLVNPLLPQWITFLKNKHASNHDPEYEVQGVNDPFLQVSIIQTLRMIFMKYSDLVNSQCLVDFKYLLNKITSSGTTSSVAGLSSNGKTSSSKKSLSVKYEAIKTVLILPTIETSLKTAAINVLLKFLTSKDANHKYVALNTLISGIKYLNKLDAKHLRDIFACLYEADPSIKQRALELSFEILSNNKLVEEDFVIGELMRFLSQCDENDKNIVLYAITKLMEFGYFSNTKTGLQNLVYCIKYGGKYLSSDQINDLLISINNNQATRTSNCKFLEELIKMSTTKLASSALEKNDDYYYIYNNYGLKLTTIWCLGEYGDIILSKFSDESTVLKYLFDITNEFYDYSNNSDSFTIVNYLVTTILKLSVKFTNRGNIEKLRQLLLKYSKETDNLVIKMKSSQYLVLFQQPNDVKLQIFDKMPVFERSIVSNSPRQQPVSSHQPPSKKVDLLTDLLGDMDVTPREPLENQSTEQKQSQLSQTNITVPTTAEKIYENEHIEISTFYQHQPGASKTVDISLFVKLSSKYDHTAATTSESIENIQLFVAVSKTQKISLGHLSGHSLIVHGNSVLEQRMKIQGSGPVKTRMKIQYEIENFPFVEQFDHTFGNLIL
ncbi:hypothetical protein ACO0QE_004226 [Hanseniaspora vineae]